MRHRVESVQNPKWHQVSMPSFPLNAFLMLNLGGSNVFLYDEDTMHYTFVGCMRIETGMPSSGELWNDLRRSYYVGRFWAGEHANEPASPKKAAAASDCKCDCCTKPHLSHGKMFKRHGYGQLVFEDGRFYHGEFHNDQFHGNGIFIWPNGDAFYGTYKHGSKQHGRIERKNGDFFVGHFRDSQRTGFGVAYCSKTGVYFCGRYANDAREGQGLVIAIDPKQTTFRWKSGLWTHNVPSGTLKTIRSDFVPTQEEYVDGERVSTQVLVMDGLRQRCTSHVSCCVGRLFVDVSVACVH